MQRFARYSPALEAKLRRGGSIWIHAVSVGEVYVAGQLMQALRDQDRSLRFTLSTTTSTGWREAEKQIGSEDALIYLPIDYPIIVRRALLVIRPAAFLLVETELWPNLIRACAARRIPLALINGRMSDRTANSYRRLRFWFGPVLRYFDLLLMQSQLDLERYVAAGADSASCRVLGSFKYDVARRDAAKERNTGDFLERIDLGAPRLILLGGSTWPGEEQLLVDAYQGLRRRFPDLRLVLVPRHFERRNEIAALVRNSGLKPWCKSDLAGDARLSEDDVLIVDTTGELASFYPYAEVVFIGRSFSASTGGQNMLEPCLCGRPTVVGPGTENFRSVMSDLLADKAIIQLSDPIGLEPAMGDLLESPGIRGEIGGRATMAITSRRGAAARTARAILELIEDRR